VQHKKAANGVFGILTKAWNLNVTFHTLV